METTTRNATLADLAELLTEQQGRKIDVVVPASKLRSENGHLVIEGAESLAAYIDQWDLHDWSWSSCAKYDAWILVDHTSVRAVPKDPTARRDALAAAMRPGVTLYVAFAGRVYVADVPLDGASI